MENNDSKMTSFHQDKGFFLEAINNTAAATTFPARLIEKDYFCTLVLNHFKEIKHLVFKGGTCLAKIHANFYRLSEDLDFVIPIPIDSKRKERSTAVEPVKELFNSVVNKVPVFRINTALTGANSSKQYIGVLEYNSLVANDVETIKFEVGLREPLLESVSVLESRTILINPASNREMVPPIHIPAISRREAYSEKFRAALTREEPAIRDYFDIDYAITRLNLEPGEKQLVALVKKKIIVPGNKLQPLNEERMKQLGDQLETQLKPVLRTDDYAKFDLKRSADFVNEMNSRLKH